MNSIINHDSPAREMEWQPNGRILAIGWGDGILAMNKSIYYIKCYVM